MKHYIKTFACLALAVSPLAAHAQKYASLQPFEPADVKLERSWIADRENLNIKYLRDFEVDRLLHNFRINAGLPSNARPLDGWEAPGCGLRGHFTGHYISAIANLVARTGDRQLREKLDYMVDELAKCQERLGGYLSAFPATDFDVLEERAGGVWAPYYTYHKLMQGLLDAAVKTGNQKALRMAADMADYAYRRMQKLEPDAIERMLYTIAANPGNEYGGMNDVLYQLYAQTHDERHLQLARTFDRDWFLQPLAQGRDILSGLHSNTHLPIVIGFATACELATNAKDFNSLNDLKVLNGQKLPTDLPPFATYRAAVVNFWDMLMRDHAYVNGSSSGPRPNVITPTSLTAEHWGTPGVLSNTLTREIAESCVTHNTQKLSAKLFAWTASPRYAEAYMNTFYNAVLALQNRHSGDVTYHLPLGSQRNKSFLNSATDFRCCNGSSIEAFASLNSNIYFHKANRLWVNLYVPSLLEWKEQGMVIRQSGDLVRTRKATLTIEKTAGEKAEIRLLIPSWSKQTVVKINGRRVGTCKGGRFYNLKRNWQRGDAITLEFDFDFRTVPMPDDPEMLAICYGPMLLAICANEEVHLKATAAELRLNAPAKLEGSTIFKLDHDREEAELKGANKTAPLLRLLDANALTFELRDTDGRKFQLRPLFDITNESYTVYTRTARP